VLRSFEGVKRGFKTREKIYWDGQRRKKTKDKLGKRRLALMSLGDEKEDMGLNKT